MTLAARVEVRRGTLQLECELTANDGEVVAVVGPNGAGKTTLLRALAGLTPIDAGRIELDGKVVDDPAQRTFVVPEQRRVGVVFQDGQLFPHLSAVENVAFGPRSAGVSRREATARAETWLDRLGLAGKGGDRPSQLSGGQAQRVALARALASDPAMLLLDEPLTALDAATRVEVRRDLGRHLRAFPGVPILVTHDPVDALALADRIVVLEMGRVVQEGTADEIVARPRSPYVAELVGTNLYRGTATSGVVRTDGEGTITSATTASGPVCATVHPRAVALHTSRPEGTPRNVWPVRVTHVERLTDRVRVQLAGPLGIVAEVTLAAVDELGLREGAEVWAAVKATEVDVYEA
ncbi:MAG: molybdate transport system ATP-binding protein [Actinomycetota bacterium]|jgi:molybdate transport system ATP-binding protein